MFYSASHDLFTLGNVYSCISAFHCTREGQLRGNATIQGHSSCKLRLFPIPATSNDPISPPLGNYWIETPHASVLGQPIMLLRPSLNFHLTAATSRIITCCPSAWGGLICRVKSVLMLCFPLHKQIKCTHGRIGQTFPSARG